MNVEQLVTLSNKFTVAIQRGNVAWLLGTLTPSKNLGEFQINDQEMTD